MRLGPLVPLLAGVCGCLLSRPSAAHQVLAGGTRMAWRCHGETNDDMVDVLKAAGIVQSPRVEAAMKAVDRALFMPQTEYAYMDAPQPIGHGVTISAPHMHAWCLELLSSKLLPGARVLDVGSGSGYLTAAMAYMVCGDAEGRGRAVGVEHIPELVAGSQAAVRKLPWAAQLMEQGQLVLMQGDGRLGAPDAGPYDAIHVGAAAPTVPPALTQQLAPGGRLLLPVGPEGGHQELVRVDKSADGQHLTEQAVMGVRYVPLTSKEEQMAYSR